MGPLDEQSALLVDVTDEVGGVVVAVDPPMYAVTSRLMMSPSRSTVESGMPWQMTSLTEVHNDLGKAR